MRAQRPPAAAGTEPRRPPRRRAVRAAAALGLALAAWACSEPGPAPPELVRPELTLAEDAAVLGPEDVVARFEPAAEPGAWELTADRVEPAAESANPDGPPRTGVRLLAETGASELRLARRGRYDTSAFDHVRLVGSFGGQGSVQVVCLRDGEDVGRTAFLPLPASAETRTNVIPLTLGLRSGVRFDELALEVHGAFRMLIVEAVELVDQPLARYAPDPAEGPAPFTIGREARSSQVVSPGRALAGRLVVPRGPAPRLSFSIGQPRPMLGTRGPDTLVVRVAGGGEAAVERFHVPRLDVPGEPAWAWRTLDLSRFAGAEASLRFELEPASGGDAACLVAEVLVTARTGERPPVLLVTTDTHRGDHLGIAHAGVDVATPALDALAARGVYFDRCFTWTNSTNPSHVALLTGTHPRDTGVLNNRQRLLDAASTLAERFAAGGYATWAVVSARHLLNDNSGLGQGFDRMVGAPDVWEAPVSIAHAKTWLDEAGDRPFFLWLHVFDAHLPYRLPPEFARLYAPTTPMSERQPWPKWMRGEPIAGEGDIESLRAKYKAEVSFLDDALGGFLALAPLQDAVIAFVGDHGESLGAHGIWFDHAGLYPDSLHVPLIVSWPGGPRGVRVDRLVRQTDVGRTLLDLAGLTAAEFPGADLRRHLDAEDGGAAGDVREEPHFALHARGLSASITSGGWHLILELTSPEETAERRPRAHHEVELYDLTADPHCLKNLASEEPERVRGLRAALVRWLEAAQDLGWTRESVVSEELDAQLDGLGYAETGGVGANRLWVEDDCEACRRYR